MVEVYVKKWTNDPNLGCNVGELDVMQKLHNIKSSMRSWDSKLTHETFFSNYNELGVHLTFQHLACNEGLLKIQTKKYSL